MIYLSILNKITKSNQTETFLRVMLSGDAGAGKTTSVLFGAEKPLLVIDPEGKSSAYGHLEDFSIFNESNVDDIYELTKELVKVHQNGHQLPYKSILVDSGTILYKYIQSDTIDKLREKNGDPSKHKLEPLEYPIAQKKFYDIIHNLKSLPVHLFITAHVKDNYLKGTMMKIDPNEPLRPDVEKRLPYEVHTHMMLRRVGRNRYRAERMRNDLLDADGKHLIPPTIDNFNNRDLIKDIHKFVKENEGFDEGKPQQQNIIIANSESINYADEIIKMTQTLGMSNEQATSTLQELVGKVNPYELNEREAKKVHSYLLDMVENSGQEE